MACSLSPGELDPARRERPNLMRVTCGRCHQLRDSIRGPGDLATGDSDLDQGRQQLGTVEPREPRLDQGSLDHRARRLGLPLGQPQQGQTGLRIPAS
jgi:hypothetical protein